MRSQLVSLWSSSSNLNMKSLSVKVLWVTVGHVWGRYGMFIRLRCRWWCWWWWWWYCCIGCITAGGVMCSCDIWSTLIFPFTTLPNISTVMAQQFITTTLGPLLFADGLTIPPYYTTGDSHADTALMSWEQCQCSVCPLARRYKQRSVSAW